MDGIGHRDIGLVLHQAVDGYLEVGKRGPQHGEELLEPLWAWPLIGRRVVVNHAGREDLIEYREVAAADGLAELRVGGKVVLLAHRLLLESRSAGLTPRRG